MCCQYSPAEPARVVLHDRGMYFELEHAVVSSPCPLLAPERAEEFLPAACMAVPKNSAWIALQLDLSEFLTSENRIDRQALRHSLQDCVERGDRLHDETEWEAPTVQYDSWRNRRLAIALRGWGDIVERQALDPQAIETRYRLERLAGWVCAELHARSRELANGRNWCPAIEEAGTRVLQNDASRLWRWRWTRAIAEVAVRHRNLTTISPWDLFPRQRPADLRFADLLPLVRFADSLSFQRDVDISHWKASEFKAFRQRVAAELRCHNGAGLIAKRV